MNPELRFFKQAVRMGLLDGGSAREGYRLSREQGKSPAEWCLAANLLSETNAARVAQAMALEQGGEAKVVPPPAGGVSGYRILAQLGAGGMGTVYRAEQIALQRPVALKILAAQYARDEAFVQRFMREARAAGRLSHPHVVACYDAGRDGDTLYMALELVEGGDAHQLLDLHPSGLEERQVLRIGIDCARGLEGIAGAGLVHRDIKPSNILLTADGQAKLGDLGLARRMTADDNISLSGEIFGTPTYMSAEHARGDHDLDIRSDIASLGASLYTLLSGCQPYSGQSAIAIADKVLHAPVPDVRQVRGSISQGTAHVLLRAMAKDRALRHQSAAALIADLESLVTNGRPASADSRGAGLGAQPLVWRDGRAVVRPSGAIGQGDGPRWDATLEHIEEGGATALIVDCSGVDWISSEGLALFVRLRSECLERGLSFAICHLNASTHRAICIVQLDRILPLYAGLEDALAAAAA